MAGFATGAPGSICGIVIVASCPTIAAGAGTAVTTGAAATVVEDGEGAAVGLGSELALAEEDGVDYGVGEGAALL